MGNSMEPMSGPEVPERGTGPTHARHTAGGPTTSIADPRPEYARPAPGHDSGTARLQLADAINSNAKTTTADGHAARDVEPPECADKKPEDTESPAREGKQTHLVPDRIDHTSHGSVRVL